MTDFPAGRTSLVDAEATGVLSTFGPESAAGSSMWACGVATAPGAWPSANMAFYWPVAVPTPITVTQMAIEVTTSAGNVDVGIYDESLTRLVSAGSTATAAAGVQVFDITDTPLAPGVYYLAMACSSTSAAFRRGLLNGIGCRAAGAAQQGTAIPLPSTATFAAMVNTGPQWIAAATSAVAM